MTSEQIKIEDERKEVIQDVIDRLLYLSPQELAEYKQKLENLKRVYPIAVEIRNGIRIYRVTKKF